MSGEEETTQAEGRPSWIYPQVWIFCVVIFVATPYVGVPVGLGAFLLLMAALVWNALSRSQYEKTKEDYPSLTRGDYVWNSLLLPVGVPLVVFGGLVAIYLL